MGKEKKLDHGETNNLATPNNIKLLSCFINDHNRESIAKEIFGLLNKSPDEIIKYFIMEKKFNQARDLTKIFFQKTRKNREDRDEYYTLIWEAVCNVLEEIGNSNTENIDVSWRGLTDSMCCELHILFDEIKNKTLFLARLHRSCIKLLEWNTIYADHIVTDMLEYFAERREIDGEKNRPEFSLNVPTALMKWKVKNVAHTEEDEIPWRDIIDFVQSMLPEWESLRDSERLSIFYDEKKKSVSIKQNKDIIYHIAGWWTSPRHTIK